MLKNCDFFNIKRNVCKENEDFLMYGEGYVKKMKFFLCMREGM